MAEPPPELGLCELELELELEADPEVDVLLAPLLVPESVVVLPPVCESVPAELLSAPDGVDSVLAEVGVRHGISVAEVTGAPATAGGVPVVLEELPLCVEVVAVLTALTSAALATEQGSELEVDFEPFWRPAAPDDGPVDLARGEAVKLAAPVAGALTGPPPSGSRTLAFTVLWASAVAASFGAVDTVASTARAMAWMAVAEEFT